MGSVFRKTYTAALPPEAELFDKPRRPTAEEREADPDLRQVVEKFARWRDKNGKPKTARVTTGRDGEPRLLVEAGTFVAKFRDGEGIVRTVATGAKTETGARVILADLERQAEKVRSRLLTPAESKAANHARRPIGEHLADYRRDMESRTLAPVRIKNVARQLARICRDCGFATLADIDGGELARWLSERTAEGMSPGMRNTFRLEAIAFANWLARTGRWRANNPFSAVPKADAKTNPARKRRALTDDELRRLLAVARLRPLAEHGRATVRIDPPAGRRMKRANWTFADLRFEDLEAAAALAKERHAKNPDLLADLEQRGRERYLTYLVLATTGLRKGELAQLTVGQLSLDSDPAFLTLERGQEKNRQGSTLPLRSDVAAELRQWLADRAAARQQAAAQSPAVKFDPQAARRRVAATGRRVADPLPAGEKLFDVPAGLLRIMNRDLRLAGIPKRDERGRTIDVHALRGTFATMLARSGVPMRTAQAVMRHSDPALTANVYTDPRLLDVAGAVESLPAFVTDPARDRLASKATGTDELRAATPSGPVSPSPSLAPNLAPTSDGKGQNLSTTGIVRESARKSTESETVAAKPCPATKNGPLSVIDNGPSKVGGTRLELVTSTMSTDGPQVLSVVRDSLTANGNDPCTSSCTSRPDGSNSPQSKAQATAEGKTADPPSEPTSTADPLAAAIADLPPAARQAVTALIAALAPTSGTARR